MVAYDPTPQLLKLTHVRSLEGVGATAWKEAGGHTVNAAQARSDVAVGVTDQ